ncbi:histidinol-phosphate transaminase [Paenibacillus sp. SYP-B3998]|uniref:Histidinol-phosphate aminotransferase n=1 Tax=Paenibacillus sp. SYP-B3998 TaxID=2678564 RepID=A0A6G4A6K6_9BACL|nr:histidinol-phosphate transaminase [Paenibacillus sp. SYP-B3998]NEW09439.1 histidinol-phosphate transaminase [Paenibacillus sp. SYP-B3998]
MNNLRFENIHPRLVLKQMKPYSPGKPIWEVQRETGIEKVIKLASNENPLGPSPKAVAAIQSYLGDIHRYPDADTVDLRFALAEKLQVTAEHVIVTNGADELITLLSETFLEPEDEIIVPSPTFSEYEFGATLMGTKVISVPLSEGYQYNITDILNAVTEKTKLLYLCSPNNPTGTYLPRTDLYELLEALPSRILVIFDGAYSHFVTADDYSDGLEFVRMGYPLMVTQTFSKIYGLAGIRVGYGVAAPSLINSIRQVKEPFNVNALAQIGAIAALKDDAHLEATRASNTKGREQVYALLEQLGISFTKSMSNFILIKLGPEAKSIYDQLMSKGIIVRHGQGWNLPEHIRISVGTSDDHLAFIEALTSILEKVELEKEVSKI